MDKLRILIVDPAVAVRRTLAGRLAAEPALEVVGTAADGRIALAKIAQARPDLVLLNADPAQADGPETLAAVRLAHPTLPVLPFSRPPAGAAGPPAEGDDPGAGL